MRCVFLLVDSFRPQSDLIRAHRLRSLYVCLLITYLPALFLDVLGRIQRSDAAVVLTWRRGMKKLASADAFRLLGRT